MSGIFDQIINYSPPLIVSGTVNYKGTWNASTNNPTLNDPPATSTKGDYYVVSTAGTQFTISFAVGDWIISSGTAWEKVDLTDAVSSVFGRTGAVVGVSTDYSSVGLTNTAIGASSPSTGAFTTVTASSTIAATGAVTGSNLSGTNTGDQTTITGNAGSATVLQTPRAIYGNNFDGSAALTQVIASTYGGTGNGFAKFSGPASSEKTFTLPNANATLLYDGGALGTPASGTVTNLTGTASININGTVGATTASTGAFTTLSASGTVVAGTTTAGPHFFLTKASPTSAIEFLDGGVSGAVKIQAVDYPVTVNRNIEIVGSSSIKMQMGGTVIGDFTSTGLAVTGLLSSIVSSATAGVSTDVLTLAAYQTSTGNGNGTGLLFNTLKNGGGAAGAARIYTNLTNGTTNGEYDDLIFQTMRAGTLTDAVTIQSTGNVGIGVTPSAWGANFKGLEIGTTGSSVWDYIPNGNCGMSSNAYHDGSTWYYKNNGYAAYSEMRASDGVFAWYNAASGTAGNAISFTQRMTLDASGQLGIGTSAPDDLLHVFKGDSGLTTPHSYSALNVENSTHVAIQMMTPNNSESNIWFGDPESATVGGVKYYHVGNVMNLRAGEADRITIDGATGNVGIGTSSPAEILDVRGNVAIGSRSAEANLYLYGSAGDLRVIMSTLGSGFVIDSDGVIDFKTSNTQAARIDSSGNLLVGTTSALNNSIGLSVQGSQTGGGSGVITGYNSSSSGADGSPVLVLLKAMTTTSSSARFVQFYADAAGAATPMGAIVGNGSGNVQFATISDAREKTNIQSITGSLDKVLALKPVSFDWISNSEHTPAGFIAQDVKEVFPEFVVDNMANEGSEQRYGLTGGLNNGVTAHLVKALQELNANLVAQVAALSQRISALETN